MAQNSEFFTENLLIDNETLLGEIPRLLSIEKSDLSKKSDFLDLVITHNICEKMLEHFNCEFGWTTSNKICKQVANFSETVDLPISNDVKECLRNGLALELVSRFKDAEKHLLHALTLVKEQDSDDKILAHNWCAFWCKFHLNHSEEETFLPHSSGLLDRPQIMIKVRQILSFEDRRNIDEIDKLLSDEPLFQTTEGIRYLLATARADSLLDKIIPLLKKRFYEDHDPESGVLLVHALNGLRKYQEALTVCKDLLAYPKWHAIIVDLHLFISSSLEPDEETEKIPHPWMNLNKIEAKEFKNKMLELLRTLIIMITGLI